MRFVTKSTIFSSLFSLFLALSILTPFLSVKAEAFEPDSTVYSEGVYMVNLDTDIPVFTKNENTRYYPASTTKIMTAIVVMENCSNLDAYVKVTYDATNEFWEGDPNKEGPSNAAIEVGQNNLTYRDCLNALMISSACEAANVLALNISGTLEGFAQLMTEKAKEIGCKDTNFSNAHGLWEAENYTTPYDLYLISKYAYDNVPGFMEICDTYEYEMPANSSNPNGYSKQNTNQLIRNNSDNPFYYEYAHGIKTGSIDYYWDESGEKHDGGRCLVSTASKGGFTYMLVTMQAPYKNSSGENYNYAAEDHINIYKWAFSTFNYVSVISEGEIIAEMAVDMGENADYVRLCAASSYATLLPQDLDISTIQRVINYANPDKKIDAPIEKGAILGSVTLKLYDEELANINLIAADNVSLSQIASFTRKAKEILDTTEFKVLLIVLAILIIAVIIAVQVKKAAKQEAARRAKAREKRGR